MQPIGLRRLPPSSSRGGAANALRRKRADELSTRMHSTRDLGNAWGYDLACAHEADSEDSIRVGHRDARRAAGEGALFDHV